MGEAWRAKRRAIVADTMLTRPDRDNHSIQIEVGDLSGEFDEAKGKKSKAIRSFR